MVTVMGMRPIQMGTVKPKLKDKKTKVKIKICFPFITFVL